MNNCRSSFKRKTDTSCCNISRRSSSKDGRQSHVITHRSWSSQGQWQEGQASHSSVPSPQRGCFWCHSGNELMELPSKEESWRTGDICVFVWQTEGDRVKMSSSQSKISGLLCIDETLRQQRSSVFQDNSVTALFIVGKWCWHWMIFPSVLKFVETRKKQGNKSDLHRVLLKSSRFDCCTHNSFFFDHELKFTND